MDSKAETQRVGFLRKQGKYVWVYAVWPPEECFPDEYLGRFPVIHSQFKDLRHRLEIPSEVNIQDDKVLAIVGPYEPNSTLKPNESQVKSLETILGSLTLNLTLNRVNAVLIDNYCKPDYSEAAEKLGYSQTPSGLWYLKPALKVDLEFHHMIPRYKSKQPRLYSLDVKLNPSWNAGGRMLRQQRVDISVPSDRYEWFKKTISRYGIGRRGLVAEISRRGFITPSDVKSPLGTDIVEEFITSDLEIAIQYFRRLVELIQEQGHVKGVVVEVDLWDIHDERWKRYSLRALKSLGFENIDPIGFDHQGIYFKKLGEPKLAVAEKQVPVIT